MFAKTLIIFLVVVLGFCSAVFTVSVIRVLRETAGRGNNEKMRMTEKAVAVKKSSRKKEVIG